MRILMVIHTRWTRNLGGPRVQLELAEEMRALGHEVEKFSYEDAFADLDAPRRLGGRLGTVASLVRSNRSFAARAGAWVRARAGRFDVIDANQTDLPFPKRTLGFAGLLVARSVGLIPAYEVFDRAAARRWPEPPSARAWAHRALTWPGARRRRRDVGRSFRHADLINVSNQDDLTAVRDGMGFGSRVVMFPFGLSEERRLAFLRERAPVAERLASRTVAFIGTWNSRKGAKDWPEIASQVRVRVADARFLLLGTGLGAELVLRDFPPELRPAVTVVPSYDSAELPGLLSRVAAGAFPGYLEGFGFAVLEKLAAGLPTVAYDAPGPRDVMGLLAGNPLVPRGDAGAFADRLAGILTSSAERWTGLSEDATRVATQFSWRDIARRTLETYLERRQRLAGA
jgi:glycosyltransferase involved in cell wall biosynthesis